MPRVKMLRNIGLEDARVLELDPREAREGKEIEVSEGQAEEIVRCGLGERVEKEAEKGDPEQQRQQREQQQREQQQREQQQREQQQREQQRQQMTSRPPLPPSPPVPPRR